MFPRHLVPWPSVDIQVKFCRDRPRGLTERGVAKYSDFGLIEGYILETNMSFWLVPNSVTLNDLERRCIISRNSVAFGSHYIKVVEDTLILPAVVM